MQNSPWSQILLQLANPLWVVFKLHFKIWFFILGVLTLAMPAHAAITVSTTAVGSATNFPTTSISGANGTRSFSDVGTASGATFATGLAETRWNTNGVAWGEVFKWTGTTGDVLSSYSMVVSTVSTGSFRPFLYDLGAVTFNATGSTFNPSAQTNWLSNVTLTLPTIAANTFVEFDLTGTDAIALTNGHSYAFGLVNTTTGNIVILRSNGVQSDTNGAPFQISSGGLSGTSATVPSYGAGVRNNFIAVYSGQATPVIPPTPTGLTATAGNAQVLLGWSASSGAASYNVKRATTNGGPYTTITSAATTSFTDTGLANGTTYYYVVSAVNTVGESANSSQANATPATGGGSVTYQVGTWRGFKPAAVSYTFDDNLGNQYSIAVPMFNAKGFKLTLFTVSGWVTSWTNVKNASAAGHEVASHTVTHRSLSTLSTADQTTECSNSKNAINANVTNQSCVTLAYPNCAEGNDSIAAQYYIAARTCSGQIVPATPSNFYSISSIICGSAGSVNSASAMQSKADSAASSGGWCIFLMHALDSESGYSPLPSSVLQASVNYVAANSSRFWVESFGNVVRYIKERNAVKVTTVTSTPTSVTTHIAAGLSATIYNYPVTVRATLLSGWLTAGATQNGKDLGAQNVTINGVRYIMFDVVPDTGDVVITQKS